MRSTLEPGSKTTFDGAVGSVSEVVDGQYTGRPGGPFTYREGKAQAIRELAEREGIDLAASYAYANGDEDVPFLEAVGRPRPLNPATTKASARSTRISNSMCPRTGERSRT